MKIGIDMRCLTEGKITGVEHYAIDIAKDLIKQNPGHQFIIFANAYKKRQIPLMDFRNFTNATIKITRFPNKLLNLSLWLFKRPFIDKILGGVDVFFMPNFSFLALTSKAKLIVTVHDLSFERLPSTYSFKRRLWHFVVNPRKIMQKAEVVLAVSQSTKKDCTCLFGIKPEKIKVIYPKFNLKNYQKIKTERDALSRGKLKSLPERYILYLGTIEPRKNVVAVIKAFEELKKDPALKDLYLVIAGMKGWLYSDFFQRLKESDQKNYIKFLGYTKEEQKVLLYEKALAFVYPSFFEGFGYPPLEAMACQTPVLASSHSSIPEVLNDKAVLVDPYRPFEIFLALKKILNNRNFYNKYAQGGHRKSQELVNKKRNLKISNLLSHENRH